jgi:hypothetical protein
VAPRRATSQALSRAVSEKRHMLFASRALLSDGGVLGRNSSVVEETGLAGDRINCWMRRTAGQHPPLTALTRSI